MNNKTYNVLLVKKTDIDDDTASKLAKLLKTTVEKAQLVLQKDSFVIKKDLDKTSAEKYYKAITQTGAGCRIEEQTDEEENELPVIKEVNITMQAAPLIDPTRPEIPELHSKQQKLSLEDQPADTNSAENSRNEEIKDIQPENFCPECGTIRASSTSICLHCGYDPEEMKTPGKKSRIIKVVLLIIVLIGAGLLALPYYQQFSQRQQIVDDLNLAFETRNQVTAFIESTRFWPNQNIDAGLDKNISNASIKSIVIGNNAVITVTLRSSATGNNEQTLIFTPNILKGKIVWNCLKGNLQQNLRPEICQQRSIE